MAKYKMSNGLAMMPERDMKLLKDMSKKGWHLVGIKGVFFQLEEGEPSDYDYALNVEMEIEGDMLSFYEASGWIPVALGPGYQIFRAKSGTAPIFSDVDSKEEVLKKNQMMSGKWAIIFGILLLIWLFTSSRIEVGLIDVVIMVALIIFFVFNFLPFLGFSRSLRKLRKN